MPSSDTAGVTALGSAGDPVVVVLTEAVTVSFRGFLPAVAGELIDASREKLNKMNEQRR